MSRTDEDWYGTMVVEEGKLTYSRVGATSLREVTRKDDWIYYELGEPFAVSEGVYTRNHGAVGILPPDPSDEFRVDAYYGCHMNVVRCETVQCAMDFNANKTTSGDGCGDCELSTYYPWDSYRRNLYRPLRE